MKHSASSMPRQRALLRQLAGSDETDALAALSNVHAPETEIEAYRPLGESLEWRLADVYWDRAGLTPFIRNDVPYLVNNNGRLSENAAALVLAFLDEQKASLPERLVVLELGAGTGLHARYFLDAFSELCREAGNNYYDRLTYVVTDRFEGTVKRWQSDELFAEHQAHVALRVCDANAPADALRLEAGADAKRSMPLVVFCNYILDVLPSTIARRQDDCLQQLCVRTHLAGGAAALAAAGLASLADARALASSRQFDDLCKLLPLASQLELETAFQSWQPPVHLQQALTSAVANRERVIVNTGALTCIEQLLPLLHPSGWLLINDYGPVRPEDVSSHLSVQRFGGSVALGVNFPLLQQVLEAQHLTVLAPEGDEDRRVHTRLIGHNVGDNTRSVLRQRFRLEADRYLDAPLEEARSNVAAGRANEAVAAYRTLIERNPSNWQMLGEAAEYIGLQLRDHNAGLQLARAALERNPWCSAWLWNILGDCLFYQGKITEAHEAFSEAQRIDPEDPRTNLNLAYTLSAQGNQTEAMIAIARGLAQDGRGHATYRQRLLEKQTQILNQLTQQFKTNQERQTRRTARFQ